jgi:Lrp/AsnC family transcriptional regulator for asnA, asnC and gidA
MTPHPTAKAMGSPPPTKSKAPGRAGSAPVARTLADLDDLDRAILKFLQADGRTTNALMSRSLGVSEPTIRNRINRLCGGGLVKVTAVINPRTNGFACDVLIGLECEQTAREPISTRLHAFDEVVYLGHVTGRYDLLVEMLFTDDAALFMFLNTELTQIAGITRVEILHVMKADRLDFDWRPNPTDGTS